MDDTVLAERHHAAHRAFYERVICCGPGARMEQVAGGVVAAVCPAVPERSLPNAVLYDDPDVVVGALEELRSIYASAGVRAWTVWVQPGHAALADHLEAAGHDHDGWPMRMAAPLAEVDLDGSPDELQVDASWREMGRINDAAYGLPGELERLLSCGGAEGTYAYVARVDGAPAACAMVVESGGDAYVSLVATVPACRGRGLARALMATGLRAAGERGCVTTSLEASPMGEPVYARMGYRNLGRFGLWERREPAASA